MALVPATTLANLRETAKDGRELARSTAGSAPVAVAITVGGAMAAGAIDRYASANMDGMAPSTTLGAVGVAIGYFTGSPKAITFFGGFLAKPAYDLGATLADKAVSKKAEKENARP